MGPKPDAGLGNTRFEIGYWAFDTSTDHLTITTEAGQRIQLDQYRVVGLVNLLRDNSYHSALHYGESADPDCIQFGVIRLIKDHMVAAINWRDGYIPALAATPFSREDRTYLIVKLLAWLPNTVQDRSLVLEMMRDHYRVMLKICEEGLDKKP